MKRCCKCKVNKPYSEFSKNRTRKDGYHPECKQCAREKSAKWYKANREKVIKKQKDYEANNLEKVRKMNLKSTKKYAERNREKIRAHKRLKYALDRNKIVRPDKCQQCGRKASKPLHGHHEDYSRPLDVVWLCMFCHREVHYGITEV